MFGDVLNLKITSDVFLIFKATIGSKYNPYFIAFIHFFYPLLNLLGTENPNHILKRNTISRSKSS